MKRILVVFIGLMLFAINANSSGISYIQKNNDINSSSYTSNKVATKFQTIFEVLYTAKKLNFPLDLNFTNNALEYLQSFDYNNTLTITNKFLANSLYDKPTTSLTTTLMKSFNKNGSFGDFKEYDGSIEDTALALKVLFLAKEEELAKKAISFLLSKQRLNGSWAERDNEDSIYLTSLATKALWLYRNKYNLQKPIYNAQEYLKKEMSSYLWGDLHQSARVLLALLPLEKDITFFKNSIDNIKALQLSDGSWDNNPYTTSLILQVLNLAKNPTPNPDLGSISGRVVDGNSGVALSEIAIRLENNSSTVTAKTDKDGKFSFKALENNTYTLHIKSTNHAPLRTSIRMVGDDIDLGILKLNRNANATISTLKGVVTDKATSKVLSGVTVSMGQKQTITDINGSYIFNSIEAGTYMLSLKKDGYAQLDKNITILPNTILIYNAPLQSFDFLPTATILGIAVDEKTLKPLDANVSLVSRTIQIEKTTNNGEFKFEKVPKGEYRLEIAKNGYLSVYATFTIEAVQNIDYGVVKLKKVDTNTSLLSSVQGVVSDFYTKKPIPNALVEVDGVKKFTLLDGSYAINNAPIGNVEIKVSKNGYSSIVGTTTLSGGSTLIYSPALKPKHEESLKLFGTFLDSKTSLPLSDVNVSITGATKLSTYSNTKGYFILKPLKKGKITIKATKARYSTITSSITVSDQNIEFSPTMTKESNSTKETTLSGQVFDIADNKPLSDVELLINNIDKGLKSDTQGNFTIKNITDTKITLTLRKDGYKDVNTSLILQEPQAIKLGSLYMRPSVHDLKPDLVAEAISTSALTNNVNSLQVSGDINITIANRGNAPSSSFDVIVFYDTNADQNFTQGQDRIIANYRVKDKLNINSTKTIALGIDTIADFREQPIYVYVDAKDENVELDENNLYSTAKSCGGKKGQIDLGICFDYSGSVGYLANMQKNGLVGALRDPAKFPRDGSVRLTLMTATSNVRLEPTVITEKNAQNIADKINNTYFGGNSYVDGCLRYMADKLATLPEQSSYKAITLSGDGYWGASATYSRDYAVSKGVNVIDAIAVGGGIRYSTLNAIVHPQPSGGKLGRVYRATTSEEVSNSIIQTFQKQTQISDLTLGKLQIIDKGIDQNISIKFTVGNAGVATIKSGVSFSVYEGDPKTNGILLVTKSLDANLSFGKSTIVEINNIPLQEGGSIYVVGDKEDNLVECTKENNIISSIISATTALGNIKSFTNKTDYNSNELVRLGATITNPGRLSYELFAQLILEDTSGNVVKTFPYVKLGILASKESKTITQAQNASEFLANTYTLKANLYDKDKKLIQTHKTPFNINVNTGINNLIASLNTISNKPIYSPTDTVQLKNIISNLATNKILKNATLSLHVKELKTNKTIYTTSLHVKELTPKAIQTLIHPFNLVNANLGMYEFKGVLQRNGKVLTTSQGEFQVGFSTTQTLIGSVEAKKPILKKDELQTCKDTLKNISTSPLSSIPLKQSLIFLDTNTTVLQESKALNLDNNSSISLLRDINTSTLEVGNYACLLQAKLNNSWHNLGYAPFILKQKPIRFDYNISLSNKPRLLILMDGKNPFCFTNCYESEEMTKYLHNLLSKHGYSFDIETNVHSFVKSFRSGKYSAYLLFSKTSKLSIRVQRELQEALHRGEGILIASKHNLTNSPLESAIGVNYFGKHRYTDTLTYNNQYYPLYLGDKKVFPTLINATSLSNFTNNHSAIAYKEYYKGKAIFTSFNLLKYAQRLKNEHEALLLHLIEKLKPNTTPLHVNTIKAYNLSLKNLGLPIQGEVSISYNKNLANFITSTSHNLTHSSNQLSWKYDLRDKNSTNITIYLDMLKSGDLNITSKVYADKTLHKTITQTFTINNLPNLDELIALIDKESSSDYKWVSHLLNKVRFYKNINNHYFAIYYAIEAINILDFIKTNEAKVFHYQVDFIIKDLSKKLI